MFKSQAIIVFSAIIIALLSDEKSEMIQVHRYGHRLHESQRTQLKRRFEKSIYLKRGEALSLAKKLNMKPKAVLNWFYQQRLKPKNKTNEEKQGYI